MARVKARVKARGKDKGKGKGKGKKLVDEDDADKPEDVDEPEDVGLNATENEENMDVGVHNVEENRDVGVRNVEENMDVGVDDALESEYDMGDDMQSPGLEQIQLDAPFSKDQQGSSSSNNPRKRKHCIYEDPNRANLNVSESEVNGQQPILPPVNQGVPHEDIEVGAAADIITEPGPSILTQPGSLTQPTVQGPSMYEQLQMAHTNMAVQPQVVLQPRLNIRAPPMSGTSFMPCFSIRPAQPVPKAIIKENGQVCGSFRFSKDSTIWSSKEKIDVFVTDNAFGVLHFQIVDYCTFSSSTISGMKHEVCSMLGFDEMLFISYPENTYGVM
ncbi:hypothetical protein Salat_2558700 [Sesamum alatum]|uniref:Uncharacterized protein n=1 Tax=Sesamum alatum TaxID=300844 RepID=A0AAE1XTI7_9LAMI|nr:hypothetical protein Salat_2558700 [Sesamum alatum]